jgi:uncharacterized membrane protein
MLRNRRRAAAAMLLASGSMGVVALYQYGLVKHLADFPGDIFDSDRVDAAGEAYYYGRTPDTALAIASYGATLALIGTGPADRAERQPWLTLLTTAKVAGDSLSAAWLTVEQLSKHRAVCSWCLVASVATAAALPLSLPEAFAARQRLKR